MGAPPSMRTWVAGEIVTAAEMNSDVRDGLGFCLRPPRCFVVQTTGQATNAGSNTVMAYTSAVADAVPIWDSVGKTKFTPTTSGYYECSASHNASATSGRIFISFRQNGTGFTSRVKHQNNHDGASTNAMASGSQWLNFNGSTDYVEVLVFTDTASTTQPSSGANRNAMQMIWAHT